MWHVPKMWHVKAYDFEVTVSNLHLTGIFQVNKYDFLLRTLCKTEKSKGRCFYSGYKI